MLLGWKWCQADVEVVAPSPRHSVSDADLDLDLERKHAGMLLSDRRELSLERLADLIGRVPLGSKYAANTSAR